MKKVFALLALCAMTFVWCSAACAADNPGEKLIRGVANIVTAPIEIAKQIDTEWKAAENKKARHVTMGVFAGIWKGLAYTVGRMGSGVWDVATFPFKVPANYEPIMKPDYVLDKK